MLEKTKSKFSDKFREKLRQTIKDEAKVRGLPYFLDLGKNGSAKLFITDHVHHKRDGEHVMLLTASGWAKYSRRWMAAMGWNGVHRELAILGGKGRQGVWAARVPASMTSVHSALNWLKSAFVLEAEREGRKVLRQGDVWLVEMKRGGDKLADLPTTHHWDPHDRVLSHSGHGELHIPFTFAAVPQRTLAADGRRRRQGD